MTHEKIHIFQLLNDQFDAVFDDSFVSLFAFTILKEVCNSSDINPKKIFEFKKFHFFKMANSSGKNFRVEKRNNENWSNMR